MTSTSHVYTRCTQRFRPFAFLTIGLLIGCGADEPGITSPSSSGAQRGMGLAVSPDTIRLAPGEVYQFQASPSDRPMEDPIQWTASEGEIDSAGWFRAPAAEGEYRVVATTADGRAGQAMVQVVVPSEPWFSDDFDSCALTRSASSPGFGWSESRGGADERPAVAPGVARSGACSLRFTFGAGGPGDDAWSEQRFTFGRRLTEFYLQWHQYWPDGREAQTIGPRFHHRKDQGPNNNKFLRLWDDDYNRYRVKLGFSTLPAAGGDSDLMTEYSANQQGMSASGARGARGGITQTRRGRWVQIQVHVRLASAADNDGVIEMWLDGVPVISNTTLKLYPGSVGTNFIRNGYLLGWANSGFNQRSTTYIDDLVIAAYPIP